MKYLMVFLSCLVFGLFSCADSGGGSDTTDPVQIAFTFDGVDYKWTEGFDGTHDTSSGVIDIESSAQGWSEYLFASETTYGLHPIPNYFYMDNSGITGSYSTIAYISFPDDNEHSYNGDVTCDITTYDNVGGLIIGTFTGVVKDNASASDATHDINGSFKVIRLSDDFYI